MRYNIFNLEKNILKVNITSDEALDIIKCQRSYFYEVARGEKNRALGWEVEKYKENVKPFSTKEIKTEPYAPQQKALQNKLEHEAWKKINGLNYYISDKGRIKNSEGFIMKTRISKNGYESITLAESGEKYNKSIHRLVCEAFIPNPENKETVNHKDGNKLNNLLENLEWNTWSENIKHAFDTGLKNMPSDRIQPAVKAKSKKILCVETGVVYESSQEAGRKTNIDARQIRDAATGKQKTAHGYHWKYIKEN